MALTKNTDAQVTYVQGGTGSVTRTVGDKLREFVSAADYDTEANASAAAQSNTSDFYHYDTDFIAAGDTTATFGPELVTNGSFTGAATGWTLGTNWAYGTNNVVLTNSGGSGTLSQSINVTADKFYLIQWDQTNSIENNALITPNIDAVYLGNPVIRSNSTSVFTQSQVIIASATGATNLVFSVTDITTTGTVTIDNVSVKEVIGYQSILRFKSAAADAYPVEIRATGVDNPSALSNVFFGEQVGARNTSGTSNTAVGWRAMLYNTTGYENTAFGVAALRFNVTGYRNTALGLTALRCNSVGFQNTAVGHEVLFYNSCGFSNTGVGHQTLINNNAGTNNSAVGTFALLNNTTGSYNTALGVNAGRYAGSGTTANTTSSSSTYIGYLTRASANGNTNEIVIGGNGAIGAGSNTTTIGNTSTTSTVIPAGTITAVGVYNATTADAVNMTLNSSGLIRRSTSSGRYKTSVEDLDQAYADAVVFGARPVWYRSLCEGDRKDWGYYGLIAEELATIDPRLVHWGYPMKTVLVQDAQEATEDTPAIEAQYGLAPDTDKPMQPDGVQYDRLTVMLLDVVQRQEKRISDLEARINALDAA